MSYKNLEKENEFKEFLKAALEDLGYKITGGGAVIRITDKQGNTRDISEKEVWFLMGMTVANIGRYLKESENDEKEER